MKGRSDRSRQVVDQPAFVSREFFVFRPFTSAENKIRIHHVK